MPEPWIAGAGRSLGLRRGPMMAEMSAAPSDTRFLGAAASPPPCPLLPAGQRRCLSDDMDGHRARAPAAAARHGVHGEIWPTGMGACCEPTT